MNTVPMSLSGHMHLHTICTTEITLHLRALTIVVLKYLLQHVLTTIINSCRVQCSACM